MRKEAAGWVLAILIVVASSLVTACGQSGAVKQVVSSFTTRSTAAPAHSTAPAAAPSQAGSAASPGPAAAAGTPAPAATATPASPGTSGWLWLWLALAVLAVATLTALFIRVRHRRAARATDWQTRLIHVYAKGAALHDAMAVAETPEVLGAPDAGARWADIRRRADDFGQSLYALRESAHDDQERVVFTDVLAASRAAVSAMAAERSAGGTNDLIADMVRDRLSAFGLSLRWLRNPHARPARVTGDPSGTADTDPLGWPEP